MFKHLKYVALVAMMVTASAALGSFGAAWLSRERPYIEGDYSEQRSATGADVVLIGTSWCGYCKQTRDFLSQRGVRFVDLDLESSKQAYQWAQALEAPSVPLLLIGNRQIRGFRPEAIDDALAAWAAQRAAESG